MGSTLDPHRLGDHLDRMYRAAWAMCGTPHDAEDLVQETCVRLLARPRRIRGHDEVGYLLTALRNTHINRHRARARRPQTVDVADDFEVMDDSRAGRPEERVLEREVFGWVSALPDELGAAIVAVDVVGLSGPEAARSLGITERELLHRLGRARISIAGRLAASATPGVSR